MNILLIDNSPYLQKTLQYFLHPYAPSFYALDSQEEWPQNIDIVFLNSGHQNNDCVPQLKSKKVPIVLISRDENTLKNFADDYSAVLKTPLQHNQLQDIIHHLIPETRSFKASSYLKFYERNFEEEQTIALSEDKPVDLKQSTAEDEPIGLKQPPAEDEPIDLKQSPAEDEPIDLKQSPAEDFSANIPLAPEQDLKDEINAQKPQDSKQEDKPPTFNKTQTIVIPDDIKLVDEKDSTSLHNTNTFLKQVSESIKKSEKTEKTMQTASLAHENLNSLKQNSEQAEKTMQTASLAHENLSSLKQNSDISSETEERDHASKILNSQQEDFTGSNAEINNKKDISVLQEKPISLNGENNPEDLSSLHEKTVDTEQPLSPPPTPPVGFKAVEKNLNDKVTEMINKHFEDQWKSFIHTQLKKDLKNMIHKEVTQIFKEQMKDILTTEGIQSIKKASEEISWKVIPELSKQIIQKEIKKLLNNPSSK